MSEYLFPIPGSVLRGLLDRKADAGEQFSENEIILDYMLDMDEDKKRTLREYETRWKLWSFSTVSRRLPDLEKSVQKLRNWNGLKKDRVVQQDETGLQQRETRNAENSTKNAGDETGLQQDETGLQQAHLIHTRATELQNYNTTDKNLNNNQPSTKNKGSRQLPPCLDSYDQVKDSWNEFALSLGLSPVLALSDKRKAGIRERGAKVWPIISEVYDTIRSTPFLLGSNNRGWRVDFDFIWRTEDGYLKIVEGKYANTNGRSTGHQASDKRSAGGHRCGDGKERNSNGASRRYLLATDRYESQREPVSELPGHDRDSAPLR